ncbi:MAG: hypothetical protein C0620_11065 [Desulfuromonas sp.]|nr:MAG: hypothetical protein C0620_11065 [Desulfuromonas sp.]
MSLWFRSIRSKIWLCVTIVLLGYFAATLIGFYVNIYQYNRLSHLQLTHLPLATLGDRILNLFENQSEEYEDAFLLAESELSAQAAEYNNVIIAELDTLIRTMENDQDCPISHDKLLQIKTDYLNFTVLATNVHRQISNETFSVSGQQIIQRFGEAQRSLQDEFHALSTILGNSLLLEIEQHKSRALNSIIVLAVIFLVVLLIVALSVGRVSTSLLVTPLKNIQNNVERFERGLKPTPPNNNDSADEVNQLETAFWNMTERLGKTMVSKRYLDNIISNMSGALVVLQPDLTITKINQQSLQLFGYAEAEMIGQPLSKLIACNGQGSDNPEQIKKLFRGETVRNADGCATSKSGQEIPVHFSGAPMYDDDDNLSALICVFNDVTELKEAEEKLTRLAHHDPLTGLPNRNLFFDRLEHALHDAKRHGRIFALLYLDLDKFKPINDTLGHEFGDQALREVSQRLNKTLRSDDTVARVGGDEFIIILNGLPDSAATEPLAEKVVKAVLAPLKMGSLTHQLGASVGISMFPRDGKDMDTLISQADKAMYAAKKSGGNGYCSVGGSYVCCEEQQQNSPSC